MNDTIYGAFIGCGATLAGTTLTLAYQAFKDYQKDKAMKAALLEMFIASAKSYEESLRCSVPQQEWNSSFWNRCQLEVTKYFPNEAVEFNDIIFKTSFFLRGANRSDCLRRLKHLISVLSVAKAKTQQTCTKKLLRWLQKMHPKIQHS